MKKNIQLIVLGVWLTLFLMPTQSFSQEKHRKFQLQFNGLLRTAGDSLTQNLNPIYDPIFTRAYPSFGFKTKKGHVHLIDLRDIGLSNRSLGFRIGIMTGYGYQYLFRREKAFQPYAGAGTILGVYFFQNTFDAFCSGTNCVQNSERITLSHIRINAVCGARYRLFKQAFAFVDLRPQILNFNNFRFTRKSLSSGDKSVLADRNLSEAGMLIGTSHVGFGFGIEL